jgi:hypothetical protein
VRPTKPYREMSIRVQTLANHPFASTPHTTPAPQLHSYPRRSFPRSGMHGNRMSVRVASLCCMFRQSGPPVCCREWLPILGADAGGMGCGASGWPTALRPCRHRSRLEKDVEMPYREACTADYSTSAFRRVISSSCTVIKMKQKPMATSKSCLPLCFPAEGYS